jgi:SAM-dependent methyltransferase
MILERIDPNVDGEAQKLTGLEHLVRYKKALEFLNEGSVVLDAGCGCGYGSAMLAQHSSKVIAIDNSPDAIDYAIKNYSRNNIYYCIRDLENVDLKPFGKFDLITFFEVIEHLHKPEAALKNLREHISPKGYLLLSTPNSECSIGHNPYHIKEYTKRELEELLSKNGFEVKQILGQGYCTKGLTDFIKKSMGLKPEFKLVEQIPKGCEIQSKIHKLNLLIKKARYFFVIAQPSEPLHLTLSWDS